MSKDELNKKTEEYNEDWMRLHPPRRASFEEELKQPIPVRFNFIAKFIKKGSKLLDCGSNDGYMLKVFKDIKGIEPYGLDVSSKAIAQSKKNFPEINATHGMIENMPFEDESFDVTVASQVMEHVEDPIKMVKEMHRVTKTNGMVIVTVPIGRELLDKKHIHFFNYYDIMDIFDTLGSDYKIYKYWKFIPKRKHDIFVVVCIKGKEIDDNDNGKRDDDDE